MKEGFSEGGAPSVRERFEAIGFSDLAMITAQGATRVGARRILKFQGASPEMLQTQLKADAGMTPVTAADLASEEIIMRIISEKNFPDHQINAEESGEKTGTNKGMDFIWYVDPLDGTVSFTREQKTSTVGIALYEKGQPKLAAVCRPFQKELLVAEVGKGAFIFPLDEKLLINGEPTRLRVSEKESLEGGIVYIDGVMTEKTAGPILNFLKELLKNANGKFDIRTPGTNIGQQSEVAMGHGELSLTTAVGGFYDIAPGSLLIKEAGGEFVDQDGNPVGPKTQVAIGGNKKIVEATLGNLKECFKGYQGFK